MRETAELPRREGRKENSYCKAWHLRNLMPNFGDICPRCKKNCTSDSFMAVSESSMVCRTCAAQLKAAREESRFCPIDGESMEKLVVEFVLIDKCPSCGGIWLDKGELDIIRETIRNDASRMGFIWGWLTGFP